MQRLIGFLGIVFCLPAMARLPNVVFLLADDLGYGDLACYGHPYAKTPNLDKLAREGTRFTRYYVNGNTCNPTRTALMTSRHSNSYANNTIQHGFQDRVSVTEILGKAGYRVGHFGKWHIGPKETPGTYGIHDIKIGGGAMDNPEGRDAPIYQAAMDFMEANRNVPFYINVWGHSTHAWIDPSPSLENKFRDLVVDRSRFGVHMQEKFDDVKSLGGDINQGMRKYLGDLYGLDSAVGRLLRKIDELGLRENTIIVFSSDNGPAPVILDNEPPTALSKNMLGYAGGLRGSKHNNWEGGVRAPFIVRWPGQVPAGKVNQTSIFSGLDWLPTLSSLAGASINGKMFEGRDVTGIWKGSDRSQGNPIFWKWGGLTVVQGDWKLTYQSGKAELFNLSSDPNELRNVASGHPDIVGLLDGLIKKWSASIPKEVNQDPGVFLPDPVKEAVVIGPATFPVGLRRHSARLLRRMQERRVFNLLGREILEGIRL